MEASIDFNEYLNLVQQVKTAREALEGIRAACRFTDEDTGVVGMDQRPFLSERVLENITAALKLMDHPDAG